MKSDRKPPPPLPKSKSPMRLRARRSIRPSSPLPAQMGSKMRNQVKQSSEIRAEYYRLCSYNLKGVAKLVQKELGELSAMASKPKLGIGNNIGYLLERGRLYEEYSAKRNERLRRKQIIIMDDDGYRKESKRKVENLKKSSNNSIVSSQRRSWRHGDGDGDGDGHGLGSGRIRMYCTAKH